MQLPSRHGCGLNGHLLFSVIVFSFVFIIAWIGFLQNVSALYILQKLFVGWHLWTLDQPFDRIGAPPY
jgi:hypothetical protein